MSFEQPPKQDTHAVARRRIDVLLRRYGRGGAYDNITDERTIDLHERSVDELQTLRTQLAHITEPKKVLVINSRITTIVQEVDAAVGGQPPVPDASTANVEDQSTQPMTPGARPGTIHQKDGREQRSTSLPDQSPSEQHEHLRQANNALVLSDRIAEAYSLTRDEIIQDDMPTLSSGLAQEAPVRGVRVNDSEVVKVPVESGSTSSKLRGRLHVVEPRPVIPQDPDLAMYRTKYRNLLRQYTELEHKIAAKGLLATLTRSSYRADLRRLRNTMLRFQRTHPEVADVRLDDLNEPLARAEEVNYLQRSTAGQYSTAAVRKGAGEKIVAIEKADAKQIFDLDTQRSAPLRAERFNQRRRIPLERSQPRLQVIFTLNALLGNPPGILQSQTAWFDRLREPERELIAHTFNGDASTATEYWQHKLEVLNEIRPSLFGRQRWQQEYGQAQTNLREAQQEAAQWLHRTTENRVRLAA